MTKPRKKTSADLPPGSKLAYLVYSTSPLIWLIQAAILAFSAERLIMAWHASTPLPWNSILPAAISIILLGLFRATIEAWGARRIYHHARSYLSQLRADTLAALARQSPLDKQRPASGAIASMLSEQAETVIPWLTRYTPAQWRVMVVPLAILIVVAWHSWVAALVLLVSAPLIPLFMAIVGWQAQAASERQMVEMGQMNGFLLDRLRGLSTLRAMQAVDATARVVRDSGKSLQERTMAVLRIAFLSSAVLELFSALGVALVAVYVGFHFLGNLPFGSWGTPLSMGQGLLILLLAPAFFEPLRELSAAWHDRASGIAAMQHIRQISQASTSMIAGQDTTAPSGIARGAALSVNITGLTFAHAGEEATLKDFSLDIRAGEHIALSGASGSGKSVLLALIAGLLIPQQGRIMINGLPMDEAHARQLRSHIAWMSQRPHIFTGSINSNLFVGHATEDREHLRDTLMRTGMDKVVHNLPVHILGEGGLGLSGGEVARLALLRLAANAGAGLLLLDEPTAHLDTETAQQVIDAIVSLSRDKTMIIATHDPVLLARMDRTIHVTGMEAATA